MKTFKALAACAALALVAAPALAQNTLGGSKPAAATAQDATLAADARLVRSVKLADLEALIRSEGHTVTDANADDGTPYVVATAADSGIIFVAYGTACAGESVQQSCNGINFMATWGRTATNADPVKIGELNTSKAAVSVFTSDDSVGVSRYVILDGGQTMENLKWNLRVFLSVTAELAVNF